MSDAKALTLIALAMLACTALLIAPFYFFVWPEEERAAKEFIECIKNGGRVADVPYRGRMCIERRQP